MLITNETDYALRILRSLADGERHAMAELCEAEDMPQMFAYKIIRKLADASLIKSTRGVNGGCELIADLAKVTLYDVIQITDPERMLASCLKPGAPCPWKDKNSGSCTVHSHLCQIQSVLDKELKKHTIQDMLSLPVPEKHKNRTRE